MPQPSVESIRHTKDLPELFLLGYSRSGYVYPERDWELRMKFQGLRGKESVDQLTDQSIDKHTHTHTHTHTYIRREIRKT